MRQTSWIFYSLCPTIKNSRGFIKMKTIKIFITLGTMILCSIASFGQNADFYKQHIEACLSKGDCDKAQIMYDSWKELSGMRDNTIETRIAACKSTKRQQEEQRSQNEQIQLASKQLNIGQEYTFKEGSNLYEGRVAYLDNTKQHGLLLFGKSTYKCSLSDASFMAGFKMGRLPMKVELDLIYKNKHLLGLYEEYWSSTSASRNGNHHYTVDFSDGKTYSRRIRQGANAMVVYYKCYYFIVVDF